MNKEKLECAFKEVLLAMELDLNDENLRGTPKRLAKMYANELFKGLSQEPPKIVSFPNTGKGFLCTKVPFTTTCAHHFQPVIGVATIFVDYQTANGVIGLSKFNRIVEHFAARPTLQEDLGWSVVSHIAKILKSDSVGVILKATHGYVTGRGVCANFSETITENFLPETSENFKNICRGYNL